MSTPELPEPSNASLTDGVMRLLNEVEAAMASKAWAILDTRTDVVKHRLYAAAALRHCCRLLAEIEATAQLGQEVAVRLLGRAHVEAWLYGLYLHFGGMDSITRLAQDTQASVEAAHHDMQEFDKWLAKEKERAQRAVEVARSTNARNAAWNAQHPDQPPRPMREEPHIPQLMPSGIDLTDLVNKRGEHVTARTLSVRDVVSALTRMAPKMGFGRESFTPIYHVYRFQSHSGPHPTLDLYDSYFVPPRREGGFVRVAPRPDFSLIGPTRVTSLYSTAFLAEYVLSSASSPTPVAAELRNWLEPSPDGGRGWAPG